MTTSVDELIHQGVRDDVPHCLQLLTRGHSAAVLRAIAAGASDLREIRHATGLAVDEVSLLAVLRALTSCGAASRSVDPGPPLHVRYRLTAAGDELLEIVSAAAVWFDRWAAERNR
jgi:DNA-binding HxlR family transcriptional regulator